MNILIVDDASFLRMILREILTNAGFNVIGEATDGIDAFNKYKQLSPDLVTLDITMPYRDGLQALGDILEFDKNAKVLMCSAMGKNDFKIEAISKGALGFITKPFIAEEVIDEVKRVI